MVKKYISQNPIKKLKKINNTKNKTKKLSLAKKRKLKQLSGNNLIKKETIINPDKDKLINLLIITIFYQN